MRFRLQRVVAATLPAGPAGPPLISARAQARGEVRKPGGRGDRQDLPLANPQRLVERDDLLLAEGVLQVHDRAFAKQLVLVMPSLAQDADARSWIAAKSVRLEESAEELALVLAGPGQIDGPRQQTSVVRGFEDPPLAVRHDLEAGHAPDRLAGMLSRVLRTRGIWRVPGL